MINATCNASNLLEYSVLCLGDEPPDDCYPTDNETEKGLATVFQIVNVVVGIAGNLLTLLAIPYAKRHQRFGFQRDGDTTTLYILNLAFVDFLFCLIAAPIFPLHYFSRGWPLGPTACALSAMVRWMLSFVDWLSLALIAFSRYVLLSKPGLGKVMFKGKASGAPIALVWSLALSAMLPQVFEDFGVYGYNCVLGHCSMIRPGDISIGPRLTYLSIGFLLPFVMLIFSNIALWRMVRASSTYLKDASEQVRQKISARDQRMTTTICTICVLYLVCNLPVMLLKMVGSEYELTYVRFIFSLLYWFQYSLNFFVYAASNKQYREAYLLFLREAVFCLERDPMEQLSRRQGGGDGGVLYISGRPSSSPSLPRAAENPLTHSQQCKFSYTRRSASAAVAVDAGKDAADTVCNGR